MEQKKTLWIIAAVGAFLLVVLGAAGIMYSPAKNPSPAIASVSPVDKNTNNGWINSPAENNVNNPGDKASFALPPEAGVKTNDLVVLADNATVYEMPKSDSSTGTTIDMNSLKQEILKESQPQNINITVNVPTSTPEASLEAKQVQSPASIKAPAKTSAQETKAPVQTSQTAVKKQTTVQTKSTVQAKSASTKTTAKSAPKTEAKKTQFWVQVAAYGNKKTAENARSILDENKIPADIFTFKDNKGRLFYRVRVGPYMTKSEAEYWQTRIIKIDDFAKAESFVTSTGHL